MPVPDYQTLMLPVLRLFAEGAKNVTDCLPAIKKQFAVTDEEAKELIPSGRVTLLANRTHWARTYLSKAGLLSSPKRNYHQITEAGLALLKQAPQKIDNGTLKQFADFANWFEQSHKPGVPSGSPDGSAAADGGGEALLDDVATPEDSMASADALLTSALNDELLSLLKQTSPIHFERIILELLNAMGYGGGQIDRAKLTKQSGDGGIDGVINEDSLGLDAVYIQAKRYSDKTVGRPDIQQFIGSLHGESATKGVFVTTSDFSKDAHDYLQKVQQRVVLINGRKLADLMIQHGVGVRTRKAYFVRSVDEDYFADLTDGLA